MLPFALFTPSHGFLDFFFLLPGYYAIYLPSGNYPLEKARNKDEAPVLILNLIVFNYMNFIKKRLFNLPRQCLFTPGSGDENFRILRYF
jgi:hypothetical protein